MEKNMPHAGINKMLIYLKLLIIKNCCVAHVFLNNFINYAVVQDNSDGN